MGIIDALRRRLTPMSPARGLPGTFCVPGELTVYASPPPVPSVSRAKGGALVVCLGVPTDRPAHQLDTALGRLEEEVLEGLDEVLTPAGTGLLSDAFSLDCAVTKIPGLIVWVLNPDVLMGWTSTPALLQRLFNTLISLSRCREPALSQVLYVLGSESTQGELLATVLGEVGFPSRKPADGVSGIGEKTEIFAVAQRSDDSLVTCLYGEPLASCAKAAGTYRRLCDQVQHAMGSSDTAGIERILAEQRALLEGRIGVAGCDEDKCVELASALRGRVLAARHDAPKAERALFKELLRPGPCFVMLADPATQAVPRFESADRGTSLLLFPDAIAARWHLQKKPSEQFKIGMIRRTQVLEWMANEGAGISLCVPESDADDKPYLWLSPETVRALAEGRAQ